MATSTKNANGNNDEFVKEALAHAIAKKTEGNSLFQEGKHERAAEEYHNAIFELCLSDQPDPKPEVVVLLLALFSNLSACHQAMGHYEQAAAASQVGYGHSQQALNLYPLYTKGHYRLCKARFSLRQFEEAAKTMTVAVALAIPDGLNRTMVELYVKLVTHRYPHFKLPLDIESIVGVASNTELRSALLHGKSHVVLKPGSYTTGTVTVEGFLALIGVGKVELTSDKFGHALHVKSGEVYACNLDLAGNAKKSVVCVGSANAKLSLADCVIHDQRNVGILILKGHVTLERCSFTNIKQQAVEVRRNASVELKRCFISKCHQGIIAHAGARQVRVLNSDIRDTTREGVLVYGESPSTPGQLKGVLDLQIFSSVLKGCGYHGVSLDMGIRSVIANSVLVNNSPFAIYIRGGTECMIAGCHIQTGTKSGGLLVTENKDADVTATDITFAVPVWRKFAIVQDGSIFLPWYMTGNLSGSKAVICQNNQIFVGTSPKAPTLDELDMRESSLKGGLMHSQDAGPQRNYDITLVRTTRHLGHNVQRAVPMFYVGSTFGHDVSLGQDLSCTDRQTIRILLGACGDIRNLVKTVSRLDSHLNALSTVQVVLNDNNVVLLARDVLLLSLISQRTSAADVIAIWANHSLTSLQQKLLNVALATLAVSLPDWLVVQEDSNSAAEILDVFTCWRDCTVTLQQLLNMHKRTVTFGSSGRQTERFRLAPGYVDVEDSVRIVRNSLGENCTHCFDKEIKKHIISGNVGKVSKEMQRPNPTMLDAPSLQYHQHGSSSIYRAISTNVGGLLTSDCTLYDVLLNTVTPQLEAVARMFERGSLRVAVDGSDIVEGMLCGGFLRLLHQLDGQQPFPSASPILFDFIDVSNASDYVSMPAVVQAAAPLLKTTKHATIHAQSLMWHKLYPTDKAFEFLGCSTGLDLQVYQQLLGFKLHAQVVQGRHLQTQWTPDLGTEETWLTGAMVALEVITASTLYCRIDRADYVSNMCNGARLPMSGQMWAGVENVSPLTMLHLLHLTCPQIVLPIVRLLFVADGECRKRVWELTCHGILQRKELKSHVEGDEFVKLLFHADSCFFMNDHRSLCLTISTVAYHLGEEVASKDVHQVLEAISYFPEAGTVEVIMWRPLENIYNFSSTFITLCVVADCTRLQAVGTSVPWSSLSMAPLSGWRRWTALVGLGKRSLLSDDVELLELLSRHMRDNSTRQLWETRAVLETARFVIVELLLPRPFPGEDESEIAITITRTFMTVTSRALGEKKFGFPETHTVELPTAVRSDSYAIKGSRQIGLMTARLLKIGQTQN